MTVTDASSAPSSPASATLSRHRWPMWLDGREQDAADSALFDVQNPATGETICQVARGRAADIDAAVRAAQSALPAWAAMPVAKRRNLLFEIAAHLRRAADRLALEETLSNGKPLREAHDDVLKSADAFEFYAGAADKLFGTTIPIAPEYLNYTLREPIGVTAHIAPWNYPLRLAVRSVAPALAAGNTVVLKPAEEAPLTALSLGPIFAQAGLPAGVYNVIPGFGAEAGAALASHPGIQHLSFTGSVETGIEVMQRAARNVVPVTLELGGKSPNIVFADADLDRAVEGASRAIFTNAGQVCLAGTRLLVQQPVYDDMLTRLVDRARCLRVGPGLENPDMGPLISKNQQQRVLQYIDIGQQEGGRIVAGGGIPTAESCRRGFFVEPTLLHGVSNTARVAQEEIFGPVLTVLGFTDDEQAARLANESPYGLVAGIWTRDLTRAHTLAARIQAGQVYVNDYFSGSNAVPFGGYKRSGFGRERGLEALQHYTQTKSVCIKLR